VKALSVPLVALATLLGAGGCVTYSNTSSWLVNQGPRKIEISGFSVDPRHEGETTIVNFGSHVARFEPERIELDGNEAWTGPYRHAKVSRGRGGGAVLKVE
jgi:hypothetical protein